MIAILDLDGFIKEVEIQQMVETILIPILNLPGYDMLVFARRGTRDGKLYYKFLRLDNQKNLITGEVHKVETPINGPKKFGVKRFSDYLKRIK